MDIVKIINAIGATLAEANVSVVFRNSDDEMYALAKKELEDGAAAVYTVVLSASGAYFTLTGKMSMTTQEETLVSLALEAAVARAGAVYNGSFIVPKDSI